jgi:hypothetical protein
MPNISANSKGCHTVNVVEHEAVNSKPGIRDVFIIFYRAKEKIA